MLLNFRYKMKHTLYIIVAVSSLLFGTLTTSSCSDEFAPSIFDTTVKALDRSSYTFPLDTFLVVNYQEPLNIQYLYRMRDISSDMDYNLVPCTYEKSIDFAVLCKYLWVDPYTKIYGEESFLRQYAPRIIHLIGSPGYNPTNGNEKLGEAEGGKKITLMKGNRLDPSDIESMNEYYFKTMHHEFGHILHQNKLYPSGFRLISNGMYSPFNWQDTPDSIAVSRGFISQYSANGVDDDWVELLANYLVKDTITWNHLLHCGSFDWEQVEGFPADTFKNCLANGVSVDLLGYIDYTKRSPITTDTDGNETQYAVYRKQIGRDDFGRILLKDGTTIFLGNGLNDSINKSYYSEAKKEYSKPYYQGIDGKGWTTRSAVDSSYVEVTDSMINYLVIDGIDGPAIIKQKLEMVRTWLQESFKIDLEALRKEVHSREFVTDEDGNFVMDADGKFINRFTAPAALYPAVKAEIEQLAADLSTLFGREIEPKATLIEQLRESVLQYKSLQNQ